MRGRNVKMPHNNRMSSSEVLKTNDIWSKVIRHFMWLYIYRYILLFVVIYFCILIYSNILYIYVYIYRL